MPAMGLHGGGAQRPMTQLVLQQSVLLAHATPTARHGGGGVQRPRVHALGAQHSALTVQSSPAGRQVVGGAQRPMTHALGAQQSPSRAHIDPTRMHGGAQRPSTHSCGAQHSPEAEHVAPRPGQGCHTRYEITTSSPIAGRCVAPRNTMAFDAWS